MRIHKSAVLVGLTGALRCDQPTDVNSDTFKGQRSITRTLVNEDLFVRKDQLSQSALRPGEVRFSVF